MATPSGSVSMVTSGLPARQAFAMAGAALVAGALLGFFLLGPRMARTAVRSAPGASSKSGALSGPHPKLTLEQMKQMADVQASTLVEKSKADPKNAALLVQIAAIYQATHQFKEASGYFEKALAIDPKNVSARTELASCLYYSGDSDAALSQLTQALKYKPDDANSMFNLGMIKYRGKNDPQGAIAEWQKLLKAHPDLDRKQAVESMIAEAQNSLAAKK